MGGCEGHCIAALSPPQFRDERSPLASLCFAMARGIMSQDHACPFIITGTFFPGVIVCARTGLC